MGTIRLFIIVFIFLFQLETQAKVFLPNHLSPLVKKRQLNQYYRYWKEKYVKASLLPNGGYYIEMFGEGGTGSEGHKSTSEAMGYGMLISVLFHELDPNAKMQFDGLYQMYQRHPSINGGSLMSWIIHQSESSARRSTSATDGDFDIALALIYAHRIWGSNGKINYLRQARRIVADILHKNINHRNNKLMLGDWWHSSWQNTSRPSDWMGGHLIEFYQLTGDRRFIHVRNQLYSMLEHLQTQHTPHTGLIPDFVTGNPPRPGPANTLEGPYDGHYYYNAARVPLRLILDYYQSPSPQIKKNIERMIHFFYGSSQRQPANIKGGYRLDGRVIGNYFDATFAAPIIAGATVDSRYQSYVNRGWDLLLQKKMNYYADSLNMLSLLYLAGSWPERAE
jgi:endo-1,4-beta-D-glucanase Y